MSFVTSLMDSLQRKQWCYLQISFACSNAATCVSYKIFSSWNSETNFSKMFIACILSSYIILCSKMDKVSGTAIMFKRLVKLPPDQVWAHCFDADLRFPTRLFRYHLRGLRVVRRCSDVRPLSSVRPSTTAPPKKTKNDLSNSVWFIILVHLDSLVRC